MRENGLTDPSQNELLEGFHSHPFIEIWLISDSIKFIFSNFSEHFLLFCVI